MRNSCNQHQQLDNFTNTKCWQHRGQADEEELATLDSSLNDLTPETCQAFMPMQKQKGMVLQLQQTERERVTITRTQMKMARGVDVLLG